jgi:hypothetical protein
MRRMLAKHAIARGAEKRGGPARKVPQEKAVIASPERDARVVE